MYDVRVNWELGNLGNASSLIVLLGAGLLISSAFPHLFTFCGSEEEKKVLSKIRGSEIKKTHKCPSF